MEFALVALWFGLYVVLAAAAAPVAARLLAHLPGRGPGFALPIAFVLLALPAYLVGQVAFGTPALLAGVATLVGASALASLDPSALREGRVVAADVGVDRTAARDALAVFAAAFLFLVAVRALDPAVYPLGGEKFLDFGLLKTLQRAGRLPPEDVWFANEPVRYYYGGHLVATLLSDLVGTPPRYAYNLALAGFYAALVTAAFDLGGAIARANGHGRRRGGLLAAFFVGVASNLLTVTKTVVALLPAAVGDPLARLLASTTPVSAATWREGPGAFFYFDASRVIPVTINEFPFFAWLNGDLHAHMMGTPFLLLGAALACSYYLAPASARRYRRTVVFGAVPLLGGLQAVVDTWSFPSVFGLLWLALALAPAHPATLFGETVTRLSVARSRLVDELGRVGVALAAAGLAAGVAVVVASPFLLGAATGGGRELAVLEATQRSSLGGLLLVHGAFVVAFGTYLVSRARVRHPVAVVAGLAVVVAVAVTQQFAVLAVAGPLLVCGWLTARLDVDAPVGFEAVLVVAGAGLVGLVELVYVKELAGPVRMNTVFKTYMQVWVLWGVAAGPALAAVLAGGPTGLAARLGDAAGGVDVAAGLRRARVGLVVVLVVSTSVYGAFAAAEHVAAARGPATLDATAFVERDHPEEAAAIAWLDAREGQPTLLSAPGTAQNDPRDRVMYSWGANPAASLTGVPTVAGWRHEVGYRGRDAYEARVRDVDAAYTGDDATRAAVLRRYGVEFVWVGPSERTRYGDGVDRRIAATPGLSVAYEGGAVTVYRVENSTSPANATANETVD